MLRTSRNAIKAAFVLSPAANAMASAIAATTEAILLSMVCFYQASALRTAVPDPPVAVTLSVDSNGTTGLAPPLRTR